MTSRHVTKLAERVPFHDVQMLDVISRRHRRPACMKDHHARLDQAGNFKHGRGRCFVPLDGASIHQAGA